MLTCALQLGNTSELARKKDRKINNKNAILRDSPFRLGKIILTDSSELKLVIF